MDSKELRGLMEAYTDVHTPQEVDEAVKGEPSERRADLAAERRAGHRPLPAKEGEKYASYKMSQMNYAKRKGMGEEVERVDEASPIYSRGGEQRRTQTPRQIGVKSAPHNIPRGGTTISDRDPQGKRLFTGDQDRGKGSKAARRAAALKNEELDIFDVVLEFLQAEGFAETLEEAEWLMANVIDEEAIGIILGEGHGSRTSFKTQSKDERWRVKTFGSNYTPHKNYDPEANRGQGQILRPNQAEKQRRKKLAKSAMGEEYMDEAQAARENPEGHDREEKKKYAPVRGERTPMPPRGDKRREDFEKWYAANVR